MFAAILLCKLTAFTYTGLSVVINWNSKPTDLARTHSWVLFGVGVGFFAISHLI